jgi:hypothetical protein
LRTATFTTEVNVPEESVNSLDTILDLKRREPFAPFLVVMSSGDRYLIENPDALAIGSSQLHYYLPRTDKVVHMRLSQITLVEENPDVQPQPAKI